MKTVLRHVGMHKTGSTSVQASLAGYDDGAVRYASLSHYNHSKELWAAFSSDRYKTRAFKQRGLTSAEVDELASSSKEAIRQELSYDRRTIIFSAEDICIMRPRDLQSMCDFIAPECDQIRILFYARDPAGYSSSSFQKMIKVNAKTAYVPLPKYRERLEKFYNILDEESIFVKRFDRSNSMADQLFAMS